jgi:hypothetical protein
MRQHCSCCPCHQHLSQPIQERIEWVDLSSRRDFFIGIKKAVTELPIFYKDDVDDDETETFRPNPNLGAFSAEWFSIS